MSFRALLALMAALLLAACGDEPDPYGDGPRPSPMLYEVRIGDSEPQAWLFGTIHALPDGTRWRTPELDASIDNAGMLMVEIAALENEPQIAAVFARLAGTPGQPDVGTKVPASQRPQLFDMIRQAGFSPSEFGGTETWAVALLLAQLGSSGAPENGVDRAIIRDFLGRDIEEFEGVEKQLGIFDNLPEREQRDLLAGVIEDIEAVRADPGKLRRAWLNGDEDALIEASNDGIMADPELRNALLVNRNQDWLAQIQPAIEDKRRPMIAVGAAHLVGPDGLAEMLRKKGYTVARIQ